VRHDGAVGESPSLRVVTGLGAFTRFFLFSALTLAFVGVGVVSMVRGAPWSVAVAYALLALGSAYLAKKVFPKRRVIATETADKPARRSGNPAVRARAKERGHGSAKSEEL